VIVPVLVDPGMSVADLRAVEARYYAVLDQCPRWRWRKRQKLAAAATYVTLVREHIEEAMRR
jgi:hypothetical protein